MKALLDRGQYRRHASGAGVRKTPVRVLVVLAAAMFMLLIPSGGYAVHDLGLFELDGNTAEQRLPMSAPYDWESIFDERCSDADAGDGAAASEDRVQPGFCKAGPELFRVEQQGHRRCEHVAVVVEQQPLNKDDLLNAYAALFKNTANGHVILYAGAERDSNKASRSSASGSSRAMSMWLAGQLHRPAHRRRRPDPQ